MQYIRFTIIIFIFSALLSCSGKHDDFDATGTFEATETTLFAQQNGTIQLLDTELGDSVSTGEQLALIDTTTIMLQILQAQSGKTVIQNQKPDLEKQIAVTRQQLNKAQQEVQRFQRLVDDGAAPAKSLDDARSQAVLLQKQLEAQQSALNKQVSTLTAQQSTTDAQINILLNSLKQCHICSPIDGIVIEKYAECGELAVVGKPILKIADMQHVFIRAYITSSQLYDIKLGQRVTVFADFGTDKRREYNGIVTWISSTAEFTPKTILTKDERADLVYAVKIAVENDGYIKLGMYGEVKF